MTEEWRPIEGYDAYEVSNLVVMQKGEPMQKQKFDEIVSYFNKKVSEMEIETKYKMELLGMVTALGYAHEKETHDKRTETHACDLISRQAAIDAMTNILWHYPNECYRNLNEYEFAKGLAELGLKSVPSAQPEPLTDKEQRIFLAAMGREEKVCKQVDDECRDCREPYEDSLVRTYHEIVRKVKGALWT